MALSVAASVYCTLNQALIAMFDVEDEKDRDDNEAGVLKWVDERVRNDGGGVNVLKA
jgi:hypothetical protein